MLELKVYFRYVMLQEFKNNKNTTEIAKKFNSVYGQDAITVCQVRNRFSKFRSGDTSLKVEPRPGGLSDVDQDLFRELSK